MDTRATGELFKATEAEIRQHTGVGEGESGEDNASQASTEIYARESTDYGVSDVGCWSPALDYCSDYMSSSPDNRVGSNTPTKLTSEGSNSDDEWYRGEIARAPTPIEVSSDSEDEPRRGEMTIAEEDCQRPGEGYVEYVRGITMTMRIFNGATQNTEAWRQPPAQALCDVAAATITTDNRDDEGCEDDSALTLSVEEDRGLEQWLEELASIEAEQADPAVVREIERWLQEDAAKPATIPVTMGTGKGHRRAASTATKKTPNIQACGGYNWVPCSHYRRGDGDDHASREK
ncbi:PREDICTED: uncharacterized protein LOC108375993 [Rhagoletis zephyria]|uniref:uncharacterized protein LOC108375993 n=1 Tax=Rhagoletis zephyria TaxID=28612 RepID=UPI00081127F7|nr:PREDICTED: uncharacterized protein LOC108375993 [Rhagoletis zephyria]